MRRRRADLPAVDHVQRIHIRYEAAREVAVEGVIVAAGRSRRAGAPGGGAEESGRAAGWGSFRAALCWGDLSSSMNDSLWAWISGCMHGKRSEGVVSVVWCGEGVNWNGHITFWGTTQSNGVSLREVEARSPSRAVNGRPARSS